MRWIQTITTTDFAVLLGGCFQVQLNGPAVNSTVSLQEMGSDTTLQSATTWNRNNAISLVGDPTWNGYSGLLAGAGDWRKYQTRWRQGIGTDRGHVSVCFT